MDTPTAIVASVTIGSTILGGIGGGVTLLLNRTSNHEMPHLPPKIIESIDRLTQSHQEILIHLERMQTESEHLRDDFKAMLKRAESDHREIKLLRELMISWGKADAKSFRDSKIDSDTETGEV